jgi:16S rRNA (adenine1518-N6/adenine1519-N6)-dimethyltransferase
MSCLEKTKLLLRKHRISPNKSFGQNFMIEPSFFEHMTRHVSLEPDDVVLDIGAGLGFLTRFLADRCLRVVAVEADRKLVSVLREQLNDVTNVEIVWGNVFRVEMPQFNKIVSIPPYQISSQLLTWLFDRRFDCAALVFQKEFAERLVAVRGSKDYGWLAVLSRYYFEVDILEGVPSTMFYPQPKVDSVIVRLKPKKVRQFSAKDEALFKKLVRSLFSNRNRKIRNAVLPFLKGVCGKTSENAVAIANSLPFRERRARELSLEEFGALANVLIR